MWGLFVGIGVGLLELFLLKKLIGMMTSKTKNAAWSTPITIAKFAVMLLVLFLFAKYTTMETTLFCAIGMAGVLVVVPIILMAYSIRKERIHQGGQRGDGDS